ncbi:uncharacterized protein DUF2505 [Haloactinopolyspora alba]|uniref:Uncharacterized protein DUF2505 n=1 Tax=Haloactinopolyspora alba TaxID=648780 RepID=A0A2P8DKY9_9ACTN|nr:DUF2505 domain-containing protein [Haloactinopolyspora alba]PSK97892.1 uncharacterized protein DUF2505 [Haloactinopolyspora alba]
MDLHSELRYDADPATVFEMLTDETFIARKTTAAKALRHDVTITRQGERVTIELTRVMPPDVPDFVRRFVGDTIEIQQTDVWEAARPDGTRSGTITLDMVGTPVSCSGTMSLQRSDGGTVMTIDGTVKASVPLVAGKVERAVHEGLAEAARIEESVGRAWLAEQR